VKPLEKKLGTELLMQKYFFKCGHLKGLISQRKENQAKSQAWSLPKKLISPQGGMGPEFCKGSPGA
jgi:hypothetical protein